MNKEILRASGFGDFVEDTENEICPFCKEPIVLESFTDSISLKEYEISGLCKKCQQKTFG